MKTQDLRRLLAENPYPGRGIVLGVTSDGKQSVALYFIMGRSENSRNRVFAQEPDGIRTQARDPEKMEDPSLVIYHPVRQLGRGLIVTNGFARQVWQSLNEDNKISLFVRYTDLKTGDSRQLIFNKYE